MHNQTRRRAVAPVLTHELRFAVALAISVLEGRAGPARNSDLLDAALAEVDAAFDHRGRDYRQALNWRLSVVMASVLKDPRSVAFIREDGSPPLHDALLTAIAEAPTAYDAAPPLDSIFADADAGLDAAR